MNYLTLLRQLVDQQQFALLRDNAPAYLVETQDASALPLLALAQSHLGERGEAVETIARAETLLPQLDLDARVDLAAAQILHP